jgi:hypothetical protein
MSKNKEVYNNKNNRERGNIYIYIGEGDVLAAVFLLYFSKTIYCIGFH